MHPAGVVNNCGRAPEAVDHAPRSAPAGRNEGELATVSLGLTTAERSEVTPAPGRFDRGLDRAAEVLAWEASAALLILVAVGPLALVALLLWLAARLVRRRADERLLERACTQRAHEVS